MKMYDVIVTGGGPAGYFAAIHAAESNRVLLLEKMPSPGRKLLLSGSGQCNITHQGDVAELLSHYGGNGRFLKHALFSFTNDDLIHFFEQHGVTFESDNRGKIFPKDRKSMSILSVLQKEAKCAGVKTKTNSQVKKITKNNTFTVETDTEDFTATHIIIATGGKSWPQTGSSGDGQKFALNLGHTLKKMKPALSAVRLKDHQLSEVSGNSFTNISVSLYRNNKKIKQFAGEMVITHHGYSGPVILDNSRYFEKGDLLRINFSKHNQEDFKNNLIQHLKASPAKDIKNSFAMFLGLKNLACKLLLYTGIPGEKKNAEINKKELSLLIETATAFPAQISQIEGYRKAMITAGGVNLKEVNSKTMESKIVPGLYFAGEILDIDGDSGGYNLQAAFSTGFVAGSALCIKE